MKIVDISEIPFFARSGSRVKQIEDARWPGGYKMTCYECGCQSSIGHAEYVYIKSAKLNGWVGRTICKFLCWACYAGW
jgi:hypothetical protein